MNHCSALRDLRILHRKARGTVCFVWVLGLAFSASSLAWAESPKTLFTESDLALLAALGPDVIGKPIAPPAEKELVDAVLRPRTARFRVVAGEHAGKTIEVITKKADKLPDGTHVKKPTWAVEIPGLMVQYLTVDDTGLTAPALLLRKAGLFSEHKPIEPLLLFGLAPGESKTYSTKAAARHVSKPKEVAYDGQLAVTYRNLGAYEIKTPAGTFPGLVIRCDYVGKIGPANLNDTGIRIYAPKIGLVALSVRDRFHAFMFLSKNVVDAMVLEEVPN